MSWGMVAVGAGTAIAGGLTYLGSKEQSGSSKGATKEQRKMFDIARRDLESYRSLGDYALPYLRYLATGEGTPINIESSPMYRWQSEQGTKALNRELAARGLYGSGAGVQALSDFYNRLGAEETGRSWDRLASMANLGASAASASSGQAIQTGGMLANSRLAEGNANAALYNNLGNVALSGVNAYATQRGRNSNSGLYD